MATTTNRRALLTAAMTLPAVAIASPALAHAVMTSACTKEWDRLCAVHQQAWDDYEPLAKEHGRREAQQFAELAAMRPAPSQPATPPIDKNLSLAAILAQAETPEQKEAWRRYEQAKQEWTEERAAVVAGVLGDVDDRFMAALDRRCETIAAIRDFPVTSLGMLNTKAALMMKEYDGALEGPEISALIADIRRLADREG